LVGHRRRRRRQRRSGGSVGFLLGLQSLAAFLFGVFGCGLFCCSLFCHSFRRLFGRRRRFLNGYGGLGCGPRRRGLGFALFSRRCFHGCRGGGFGGGAGVGGGFGFGGGLLGGGFAFGG
jgi:hypothetical protein